MLSRIHHEDQCYLVQELYKHTTQPHGEWGSTLHPSRAFSTTRLYLQTKLVTNKEMKVVNPHVKEEEQSCSRFLQMIKVDCLTGIQLRWFILQNSWHLSLHNRVWGTDLLKERTLHQTAQMNLQHPSALATFTARTHIPLNIFLLLIHD